MEMNKRTMLSVLSAVALIAAMVLTGCGGGGDSSSGTTPTTTTTTAAANSTFLVKDTSGAAVAGATVYAVAAADVVKMGEIAIDSAAGNYSAAAQKVDEPLEDLINGNYTPTGGGVGTYKSAVTDSSGKAVITGLPAGSSDKYFIYVKPASADTGRLPGGSLCRTAGAGADLVNKETAVTVSTTPTSSATYIGSSLCIMCHKSYATAKQTLHKLGIMVPSSPSGLQDVTKFSSTTNPDQDFYAGLKKFESGTTVYFYDLSSSNAFKTLSSDPGAGHTVYFTLTLSKAGSVYKVTFTNIITPADPNSGMVKNVALTYGGGLHKQRYLTKLGNSLYVLPLQFNPQGSDSSPDSSRTVWSEYNTVSYKWWDATNKVFFMPEVVGKTKSFDINCAGCHFNGYSVTKNADGEYMATGVADYQGEVHPVTGAKQELNIGCESCHGPGSEHSNAGGLGKFIVTPKYLTPERESMICGACHTRSKANDKDGLHVENPLDQNNKMMTPGSTRAAFLATNVTRHDASNVVADGEMWADGKHSKKHHQQYTDFIKTKKYRNGTKLLTCASCHDVHAPGTDQRQLSGTSDNSLCKSCHTTVTDVGAHMTAKTGFNMGSSTTCLQCHVTKTAKSGSGNPTSYFTGLSGTKYYQNDISSHVFDVPLKTSVSATNAMPIPYTDSCGACHQSGRLSKQ